MLEELGIQPIRLELPFRLNHVNCFIAEGEHGWKIIDTGLHDKQTVSRWKKELAGKEVSDILITHYHPDHFGYAGGLQTKTGAQLSMSKIDHEAGLQAWQNDFLNSLSKHYLTAGIPSHIAKQMLDNTREFVPRVTPHPDVHHHFQEGEKITFGKWEYEVIFTPGHSDGLISLYNRDKRALLSTDHVLPKITPNISYWFHGDQNPLATYLDSLKKIKPLDAEFVIPSHGKPFYGANERINEIIVHHDDRLAETLEYVDRPQTVYDICGKLFQKELTIHETRFAIGETLAHLEFLRIKGEIQRTEEKGVWYYQK